MAGCTGTPESDKMWLPLEITYILNKSLFGECFGAKAALFDMDAVFI